MKRQTNIIRRITFAAGLAAALASANAQTWSGGADGINWNDGGNWIGNTAPAATGASLIFVGGVVNGSLDPNDPTYNKVVTINNLPVNSLNGITFGPTANEFYLQGGAFTLAGNITNNSGKLQTITNGITLGSSRQIHANSGEIRIQGAIGHSNNNQELQKYGAGTLTLAGANTFNSNLVIFQGKVVLDAGSGGSISGGNNVQLGQNSGTLTDLNQGGVFEALGARTGTTTASVDKALQLTRPSGANRVVVNSNGGDGTLLQFLQLTRSNITSSNMGAPTLNIDLSSSSENKFLLTNAGNFNSHFVTITDTTKTGFAVRNAGGEVTRITGTNALPATGGGSGTNYHTGTLTLTGNVASNTVTINGGARMSEDTMPRTLTTNAILMHEDAGSYEITIDKIVSPNSNGFYIHQYSTGTLTINSDVGTSTTRSSAAFIKTGPGAVVFNGGADGMGGTADVQQGLLTVNGSLSDVQVAQVRSGATLVGSGKIGGGTKWDGNTADGTQYTQVNIWSGGTLDGSYSSADALDITGKLTFSAGATYEVHLAGGSGSALSVTNITSGASIVTLAGDLKLTLGYVPILGDEINLLTSTGGLITGTFATINGEAATPTFVLGGYEFGINYDANRVWLNTLAIPEPSSVLLLLFATAFGITRRRRSK